MTNALAGIPEHKIPKKVEKCNNNKIKKLKIILQNMSNDKKIKSVVIISENPPITFSLLEIQRHQNKQ
jgi:hypothetical protein